jgi:hypothetical protein
MLAAASLAWVGSNVVWPRRAPQIWSASVNESSLAARSPDADFSDWTRALGYFSGRHTSSVRALEALVTGDPGAADEPRTAAAAAIRRYLNGDRPAASSWQGSIEEAVHMAVDSQADVAVRCEAIRFLENFLRHAEQEITAASAETERRATIRAAYLQGMESKRSRLRKVTDTEG